MDEEEENGTTHTVQVSDQDFNSTESLQNFPVQFFVQYDISDTLLKVVSLIILLLGTFGNVMTVLVMRALTQSGGNQLGDPSICVYFPCMAVSDQIVLTVGLGRKWIKTALLYDVRSLHVVVCKLHKFVVFVGGRSSSWILVAVTSQRVMTVTWPLRQRLTSTKKRAALIVLIIVSVSTLLDIGILFLYAHFKMDSGIIKCQAVKDSPEAAFYEDQVYPWLNIISGSLLPLSILVVNNIILGYKVRQSVNTSRVMTDAKQTGTLTRKASSLSLTLIVTSLAFVLLTSPIPASFVIKYHLPWLWRYKALEADIYLVDTVLDLLWYCNSAVNFYLYFLTGPTFRREAGRLLCAGRKCHLMSRAH